MVIVFGWSKENTDIFWNFLVDEDFAINKAQIGMLHKKDSFFLSDIHQAIIIFNSWTIWLRLSQMHINWFRNTYADFLILVCSKVSAVQAHKWHLFLHMSFSNLGLLIVLVVHIWQLWLFPLHSRLAEWQSIPLFYSLVFHVHHSDCRAFVRILRIYVSPHYLHL